MTLHYVQMMRLFIIIYILSAFQVFSQEVWTVRQSGTDLQIDSVGYANTQFLAAPVDYFGQRYGGLLSSHDGKSWSNVNWANRNQFRQLWAGTDNFLLVSFSDELWISEGSEGGRKIPMGQNRVSWGTTAPSAAFKDGTWVVSNGYQLQTYASIPILIFNNGALRRATEVPFSDAPDWVMAVPDGFIALCSGATYASPDGEVWTLQARIDYVEQPVVKGAVLYASGMKSNNWGKTWVGVDQNPQTFSPALFAADTFISFSRGDMAISKNYSTWTTPETGTTDQLKAVAYGGGIFVAVGHGGRIVTSPAVAAPPVKMPVEASITASVTVKWPSVSGRAYTVESSADLQEWRPEASGLPGTGAQMTRAFDVQAGKKYFRVMEE